MKFLLLNLFFIISLAQAGGIGGMQGGHVNFQRESTFVSPLFSKSLCFDGVDYHAEIRKCVKWDLSNDDVTCVRYEKVKAMQPMVSTREHCEHFGGNDDNRCEKWVTVPFIQKPERKVQVMNDGQLVKEVIVKVRDCQ